MFGLYRKTEEEGQREGRSIYIQEHGDIYYDPPVELFSDRGIWVVKESGNSQVLLSAEKPSESPTSVKWKWYRDKGTGTWQVDPALTVVSLNEKPSGCEITIHLSGDISSEFIDKGVAGVYRSDGLYQTGRPVFKHWEGIFEICADNCWKVGSDHSWELESGSAPSLCPADPRAAWNEFQRQNNWEYNTKLRPLRSQQRPNPANKIRITCKKHNYCE